jgi:hypothetical protein
MGFRVRSSEVIGVNQNFIPPILVHVKGYIVEDEYALRILLKHNLER